MKKLLINCFFAIVFLTACENPNEDFAQSSFQDDDVQTFVFSNDEVETLILEKLGHVNLTFQEKSSFLSEHVITTVIGSESSINPSSRTSLDYTSILCMASVYDGGTDEWIIKTKDGDIGSFINITNRQRRGSSYSYPMGASAQVWIGIDPHYYERLDYEYLSPQTISCGSDKIARAQAYWENSSPHTYTLLKCDD